MFENFTVKSKRDLEEIKLLNIMSEKPSDMKNKEELAIVTSMLPLQSIEAEIMNNTNFVEMFEHLIIKVGGKNGKKHLCNEINFCFDLELQKQMNWSGFSKVSLKDKKVISKIVEIAVACQKELTTHDATQHIKYLFQNTFDRAKALEKKPR